MNEPISLEDTVYLIKPRVWENVIQTNSSCYLYLTPEQDAQMLMLYNKGPDRRYRQ